VSCRVARKAARALSTQVLPCRSYNLPLILLDDTKSLPDVGNGQACVYNNGIYQILRDETPVTHLARLHVLVRKTLTHMPHNSIIAVRRPPCQVESQRACKTAGASRFRTF